MDMVVYVWQSLASTCYMQFYVQHKVNVEKMQGICLAFYFLQFGHVWSQERPENLENRLSNTLSWLKIQIRWMDWLVWAPFVEPRYVTFEEVLY